jgi:uncharacterized protein (TIGR01777 family)
MKALITGATGLVGEALVKHLLDFGWSIHYLTTSKSKIENSDNFKGFYWNPETGEIDKNCFDGVGVIINLAGASVAEKWTDEHKKAILDSRLDTLNLLFETLVNISHEVKHIVSASAIGIYPHSFTKKYTEKETELNNDFLGDVVQQWEKTADRFKLLGLMVTKIRIGIVLSSKGGALKKMETPIKYFVGAPLGNGKQWQSWIHINDLVGIFKYVIDEKLSGVYNGVAPGPVKNRRLTKAIATFLHRPILLPPVPEFVLKYMLGEMSQIVLSSQKVSSDKIEREGYVFQFKRVYDAVKNIYD